MKRFADLFSTNEDMGVETTNDLSIDAPAEDAQVDLVQGSEATEPTTGVTVVEIDHSNGTVSVNGNTVNPAAGADDAPTIEQAVGGEEVQGDQSETGAPQEDPQEELDEQSQESETETSELNDAEENPSTEGQELDDVIENTPEVPEEDQVSSELILGQNEPADESEQETSEDVDITDVDVEDDPEMELDDDTPEDTDAPSQEPEDEPQADTEAPESSEQPTQTPEEEAEETPEQEEQESPQEQQAEQDAGTEQTPVESESEEDTDDVLDADLSEDDGQTTAPVEAPETAEATEAPAEVTEPEGEAELPEDTTGGEEDVLSEDVSENVDVTDTTDGQTDATGDTGEVVDTGEPAVDSDDLSTSQAEVPEQTANTEVTDSGTSDETAAVADGQTAMVEGDQVLQEEGQGIEQDGEAATLAMDATDKLQELVGAAERAKESGGFTQDFAQVVEITHEAIVAPLGMSHRKTQHLSSPIVSLEHYSNVHFKDSAVEATCEKIRESIRQMIERVINALRNIATRIYNYGKELFSQKKTLEQQIASLEKAAKAKKDFKKKEEELGEAGAGARIGKEASAKTATDICLSAQRLMTASYAFMADVAHAPSTGKSVDDLVNMRDKYIGRIGGGETPGTYGNLGKGQSIEFAEDESGKLYIVDNGDEHSVVVKAPTADEVLSVLKAASKVLEEISEFNEITKYAETTIKGTIEKLTKGVQDEQAAEDLTAPARALLDFVTFFSTTAPRVSSSAVREVLRYCSAGLDNLRKA